MKKEIGKVVLDYECYPGKDLYSDGDIEDTLLDIVKNNSEKEFNKIIFEKGDWAIMYHLSPLRANILNWYPIEKSESVLEIGSGCGAITSTLADKAGSVTCIDLSEKRSLINAYRNKDRDNITIKLGNFEKVEKTLTQKYDIITLIGVFEYGEAYISTQDPYLQFLKIIKKHLKKNGKIIIAIENKFGLKYWSGCQEDHFGGYFVGIENYIGKNGVKTFSKEGITGIIEEAGFMSHEFYYPYPDYKFADTIYSDYRLPMPGELRNNMRNFDRQRMVFFDETKVFNNIIEENLFPLYSNSFLIIIKEGADANE
ncbi:Methyltransferase domain-containing protein [Acetitomaculum ruminis DSM 5522]|uniref:Methyltransferase domain-containing protein n=1 Tax=Acetitomaculum ruminis DSM 5522 TaxID=1120918 RepID=A0A1I0VM91_9FIRM|nr:class I SAM-dependent methyltransferase [Acetitomaculum ruminis]SFA77525.1 Methyltransferase domain-containing protein [Acetitomaculum ruminis DSM 5522]